MPDLLIRGGTVVTATGSRTSDVLVRDGSIAAVDPELATVADDAGLEIVDAEGLLLLPGAVDVHTHTRVATDAEPDRFFQDSVAAAFGGTTTFLAFNNPGTGSSQWSWSIPPCSPRTRIASKIARSASRKSKTMNAFAVGTPASTIAGSSAIGSSIPPRIAGLTA